MLNSLNPVQKSRQILFWGMAILLSLLIVLFFIGIQQIENRQANHQQVTASRVAKSTLISKLEHAATRRLLLIRRAAVESDPFERDRLLSEFRDLAAQFVIILTEMRTLPLDARERELMLEFSAGARKAYRTQDQVTRLLEDDEIEQAQKLLNGPLLGIQSERILNTVATLSEYQQQMTAKEIEQSNRETAASNTLLMTLAIITLFLGIAIAYYIVRKAGHFNEELLQARLTAESASRAKSDFLSSMSHELHTPLNAIMGFSQLIQMRENLDKSDLDSLQQITESGQHMLDLVDDILELVNIDIDNLSFTLSEVPFKSIIYSCEQLSKSLAEKYSIEFEFCKPDSANAPVLYTDSSRIKYVLLKLLHNAAKYNREGGKVIISCSPADDSRMRRISVTDTGHGLAQSQIDQLFQPFVRVGATSKFLESTGISLSISKKLIEAMGGEMGVESEVGKGSTFWVEIPEVKN